MIRPFLRPALVALLAITLVACKTEEAQDVSPIEVTPTSIGHYCQMNLLEHDGPQAQVHLEGIPDPLFFSQVRDAIAFSREPEQIAPILAIYVNDMGREDATWEDPGEGNWIPAEDAYYIIGSAREGGMGAPETVPFAEQSAAEVFAGEEGGEIMRLADIPDDFVLAPVEMHDAHGSDAEDEADFTDRLRNLPRPGAP